jgi:tRNA(Ile)-lysidine synthase
MAATPRATTFTSRVEKRVADYIAKHGVIVTGESVLVGVSGGPDSSALLIILSHLRKELGLTLTAAHFDHMLRSRKEAEDDRAYVEKLAKSFKVPFVTARGDVARRAKKEGESIEEAARELRYRFLGAEAAKAGATAVVVGHTLDDRAETVLLHLIRGSGLDGLAAMPSRSPWPFGAGPDIARPLLELTRAEIEKYCEECGIVPRQDPTNEQLIATRNRVRHELMPVLRSFNPKVSPALTRLADAAARDVEFIDPEVNWAWARIAVHNDGHVSIRRDAFSALPPAVAIRVLRRAAAEVGSQPEAEHIERMLEALEKPRSKISLPGGIAEIDPERVLISGGAVATAEAAPREPETLSEVTLKVPGRARSGDWTFDAQIVEPKAALKASDALVAMIAANAVEGELTVRSRKPGDRMRPLGLRGTKKLQDILVDAKVPAAERDLIPVIADEQGIVWLAGHCLDERVAVTARTRRVLRLRARRKAAR